MGDVLYIQTDKNRIIKDPHVQLQQIADLSCSNTEVLNRCKVLRILTLPPKQYGRYTVTVLDLIEKIQKSEEKLEIQHIGEPELLLTYENPRGKQNIKSWAKTLAVCLITFFGTMFSIMTFNTDVDILGLFEKISGQIEDTGQGIRILEAAYSIGIGMGVVFFFNHFGKWKITQDPTPMEVEMQEYETQIDDTILEMEKRKEKES